MPTTDDTAGDGSLRVEVEEGEGWKRLLTVTVSSDRVRRIREEERRELGGSLDLKGFRPGKVPPEVVEKRYGRVVDERTARRAVEEAYREAVRSRGLRPVEDPEVRDVSYREGEDLTFRAAIEIVPEVRIERRSGFRVERPGVKVTDRDVEEIVARIREDHAVWRPVERKPVEGDQVSVRIRPEGEGADASSEPYRFELGDGYAIPDVEEAIRSLEPEESGVFEVTFPEDFDDGELAGRRRRLEIELLAVQEKELPEADDGFAARVGDFDAMAELEEAIRDDLRRHGEEEAEEAVRRRLLDAVVEANPVELPEVMVDRYLDRVLDVPPEADPERVDEVRREVRPRAERELKRQLVMDRMIEDGGYEATEEELERRLREIAERRDEDVERTRRRLRSEGRLEGIRRHLETEKLFEELKSESRIVEGSG